jgi:hypothetical protein
MLNAVSVHLDEHEAGRVNALRKPALQPIHPMLLEPSSVANDCRAASMERKMPGFPRRLGGSVNDKVTRGSRRMSATLLVSSWEKNHESPSYSTSPIVAHRAMGNRTRVRLGRQHAEIDLLELFGDIGKRHPWPCQPSF